MRLVTAGQTELSASYLANRALGPTITHEDFSRLTTFRPRSTQVAVAVRIALERPNLHVEAMRPTRNGWGVIEG